MTVLLLREVRPGAGAASDGLVLAAAAVVRPSRRLVVLRFHIVARDGVLTA